MNRILLSALFSACLIACEEVAELIMPDDPRFKVSGVENTRLNGILIQNMQSPTEISITDYLLLGTGFAVGNLPLKTQVNLDVENTNSGLGTLTSFDWILAVGTQELARGTVAEGKQLPSGTITRIPLSVEVNLMETVSGQSLDALLNLCMAVSGYQSDPTRLTVKIKPYISILGQKLSWPDYFVVTTTFSSGR